MSRKLQFAEAFFIDIERYYDHLTETDPRLADRAYDAISKALSVLEGFPLIGRRVAVDDDTIMTRELLIPFGTWGYVVLYEVEDAETVTILAIRHQREDDYH
ncbi:type II toxin-antitoxin system RelE/ParE family toxin [Agrobacterium sp. a22-2]|uniref:type II toxin-antitoxin system RelE/ParE family toxin n=1 Tax=Agrobacterium sp. a22-2 TaxID=2283840 RepID=UPI001445C950|nr:type II toxin-antitoxin system RelE/ParE family toxin [Agrobacterium sp. a22-2]NKN39480.1 type II toxin-antitoxin system RelE/ParE family toxin [Agrobacterium sp. a22-2]